MKKITPSQLIKSVPDIQTLILPNNWFENLKLDDKYSIFHHLYKWINQKDSVPIEIKDYIYDRTFVGEKLYKKLILAETKRLKKICKHEGEDLREILGWICLGSAPYRKIANVGISGDAIFIVPESSWQSMTDFRMSIEKNIRQAKINKIREQAAGTNFYHWLISQVERPDLVGHLAEYIEEDQNFPKNTQNYEEVERYIKSLNWTKALRIAWKEYMEKYPQRIKPCAYCYECEQSIAPEDAFLVLSKKFGVMVMDSTCLDDFCGYDNSLIAFSLSDISQVDVKDKIQDFVDQDKSLTWQWEGLQEKLEVWGVSPSDKLVSIYFIQSENDHAIKIGYTAGDVQKRLKELQTSNPYQLKVLATMRGKREYEKSIHQKFEKYRLNGEWFEAHPDLLAFISLIKKD